MRRGAPAQRPQDRDAQAAPADGRAGRDYVTTDYGTMGKLPTSNIHLRSDIRVEQRVPPVPNLAANVPEELNLDRRDALSYFVAGSGNSGATSATLN